MRERLSGENPATEVDAALGEREFERHLTPADGARQPGVVGLVRATTRAYRMATRMAAWALGRLGRRKGKFQLVPLAGGWTEGRDLPAPEGKLFCPLCARAARRRS